MRLVLAALSRPLTVIVALIAIVARVFYGGWKDAHGHLS